MKLIIVVVIISVILFLSISTGVYLSHKIIDTTEYALFWLMYILSVLTLLNIGGGVYYYISLKDKVGPRGPRGDTGDVGDTGETGLCSPACRNNMCTIGIQQHIIDTINNLEKSYGDPGNLSVDVDLRNPYIKEKIKSMCTSEEYQQMAPIKGMDALNTYILSIWTDITTRLYNSGGVNYFRTIGAEYDWDWLDENPWDEFKKYDIYYWGMGKEYRPRIKDIIITDTAIDPNGSDKFPAPENRKTGDNELETPGEEMKPSTDQKDVKYSILAYVNIPATEADGKTTIAYIKNTKTEVKLYSVHTFTNSDEILSQYSKTRNIRYLNPLSFMVVSKKDLGGLKCVRYNSKNKETTHEICNSYEPDFIFHMEMLSTPESKMMEFKLCHTATNTYLSIAGTNYNLSKDGNIFSFKPKK